MAKVKITSEMRKAAEEYRKSLYAQKGSKLRPKPLKRMVGLNGA